MRMIRSLIALLAVVALALGLAGPAAAQKLVISNWDAYMPPDFLENFTKETGIQTEISLHATNEEIRRKGLRRGLRLFALRRSAAQAGHGRGAGSFQDPEPEEPL